MCHLELTWCRAGFIGHSATRVAACSWLSMCDFRQQNTEYNQDVPVFITVLPSSIVSFIGAEREDFISCFSSSLATHPSPSHSPSPFVALHPSTSVRREVKQLSDHMLPQQLFLSQQNPHTAQRLTNSELQSDLTYPHFRYPVPSPSSVVIIGISLQ